MNEPRIAILGTVEVTGTKRTTSLAGTNMPALLSMLALTPGHPVPNDRVLEALWPDTDPAHATRSLISLVHHLNVTLGAHLGIHKPVSSLKSVGRILRVDPATIDVIQFEQRLAEADAHVAAGRLDEAVDTYEDALALWRGEPFGGLDLPCFVESSARLRIARHRGEAALIDASLRVGRGAELVPWLLQRVDAEPFDDHVVAAAARALYQAGRSGDALRVLRACMDEQRRRGVDIHATIRQLEIDVLDHTLDDTPDLFTAPAESLDEHTTGDVIVRLRERAMLDVWLTDPAGPAVMVITGDAGMGKTALIDGWLDAMGDSGTVVRGRSTADGAEPLEPFIDLLTDVDDAGAPPDVLFDEVVLRVIKPGNGIRLLAIDDAQWLRVEAVALLRHVLWHPDVHRLRVVLAIRSPDGGSNGALAQILTDLVRAGQSTSMRLAPFERDQLDGLVARRSVRGADAGGTIGVDLLWRSTGGNPRLVAEVLRGRADGSDLTAIASGPVVASLYGRYLSTLPAPARRIVEMAALLGDGDPSRLADRAGTSELEVIDALDLVADGRLVHVEPLGGDYRFVNDLARLAVLAGSDAALSGDVPTSA